MEQDILDKIKLYKSDVEALDLLCKEINNIFLNYDYDPNGEFLEIAYEFLINKDRLEGIEYRFLCWLNVIYKKNITITLPTLATPVLIKKDSFFERFVNSDYRRDLFEALEGYIRNLKAITRVENFDILIGGSFTDSAIKRPNDIDLVLLVPKAHIDNPILSEGYQYAFKAVPGRVDIKFLPIDYNFDKFKAFSNIICLGNFAEFKDKDGQVKDNTFVKRTIFRIVI